MFRIALVPLLLILAGCPDSGGGGPGGPDVGTEIGNPDLTSDPNALRLETACPGATLRTSVLLTNLAAWDVDATAGGTKGEEAYPSAFEVDRFGSRELVVVIPVPPNAGSSASGKVQVHHRREGVRDEPDKLLEIPWSASTTGPSAPAATVLCGEEIACANLDFGQIFTGASWQLPLEVANDGCAPLTVQRIEAETGDARVVGPALPATLQPGERWRGRLVLEPVSAGRPTGSLIVATDDAAKSAQQLGWRADVR